MDRTIVQLIDQSIDALKQGDVLALRKVSARAIEKAAVEEHRELILIGLIDYALSKIMSKTHYEGIDESFYRRITEHLEKARIGPKDATLRNLEVIEDLVIKLDEKEGRYEDNIIDKARVKKAAKLYYQGLSLRRASDLTGADPSDVSSFIGQSKIHEFKGAGELCDRIKIAREVFK